MAITNWLGNALAVAQVTTWTFAGTWEVDDIVTITINGKTISVTTGSTVISTLIDTIVTVLNASVIAEFAEITWSKSGTTILVGTSDTAGEPFSCTLKSSEANLGNADSQTIDAVATSTLTGTGSPGVDTTTCTGPNFANNANNFDSGLPADGDTVVYANSDVDVLYGLGQSAITPAAVYIDASYTGNIGLPLYHANGSNPAAYAEYRTRYLSYGNSGDATNMKVYIGRGPGSASGRINLDNGTGQATIVVYNTGTANAGEQAAFYWKGTHASNSLSVLKGKVGVAYYSGELATVVSPTISYVSQRNTDAVVIFGNSVTITTGMNIIGGQVQTQSNISTTTISGGTLIVYGIATATLINIDGGTVNWASSGTVTATKIGSDGIFDAKQNTTGFTMTDCTINTEGTLNDPFRKGTYTNPIILNRCGLLGVTIDLGEHITLAKANGA